MERRYRNVSVKDDGQTLVGEMSYDGKDWYDFEGTMRMIRIEAAISRSAEASNRIWDVQDGYGEPGFYPAQGWDWSGIRDSSEEVKQAMEDIAREYVDQPALYALLGWAS